MSRLPEPRLQFRCSPMRTPPNPFKEFYGTTCYHPTSAPPPSTGSPTWVRGTSAPCTRRRGWRASPSAWSSPGSSSPATSRTSSTSPAWSAPSTWHWSLWVYKLVAKKECVSVLFSYNNSCSGEALDAPDPGVPGESEPHCHADEFAKGQAGFGGFLSIMISKLQLKKITSQISDQALQETTRYFTRLQIAHRQKQNMDQFLSVGENIFSLLMDTNMFTPCFANTTELTEPCDFILALYSVKQRFSGRY